MPSLRDLRKQVRCAESLSARFRARSEDSEERPLNSRSSAYVKAGQRARPPPPCPFLVNWGHSAWAALGFSAVTDSVQAWAAALRFYGVPAVVSGGAVRVDGVGEVPLPDEPFRAAARQFVIGQTSACRARLLERVARSVDLNDPRITVSEGKGRLRVRAEGVVVATLTRWEITRPRFKPVREDLIASDRPLSALAEAVRHVVVAPRSGEPSPALAEAVYRALAARDGATRAELAEALGIERTPVMRSLTHLIAERRVTREKSGEEVVYRVGPARRGGGREALDEIVQFLHDGRILDAHITAEGYVRLGSVTVRPPDDVLTDATKRLRWLDAFVAERCPRQLLEAAQRHLGGFESELQGGDVAVFDTAGTRVAQLRATRARPPGAPPVDGNFLTAGPHWARLVAALGANSAGDPELSSRRAGDGPGVAGAPLQVAAGLHRELPPGTAARLREDAEAASRRLRHERTRVYGHKLQIDVGAHTLTFQPLTGRPLAVPFTFDDFTGALRITAPDPMLPCEWKQPSDARTLGRAWSLALVAYAELTCLPVRVAEPRPRDRVARPGIGRGRSTRSLAGAAPSGGLSDLPPTFRPQGATARMSYVAGHRRRLRHEQHHSPEAVRAARAVGIILQPDETWVKPFTRGVPPDTVLHFAWRGPRWARD
jgi:hypothetical protein